MNYLKLPMKTNFKPDTSKSNDKENEDSKIEKNISQNEFEDFVSKSGAKGSFMIFRSKNKNDELGIDQL